VERNLVAAAAFAVAAVLVGVPVIGGLACLLAFGLAALVVRAVQRRRAVVHAGRVRPAPRPATARPQATRPRPPRVVVDDSESYGWPRIVEPT